MQALLVAVVLEEHAGYGSLFEKTAGERILSCLAFLDISRVFFVTKIALFRAMP